MAASADQLLQARDPKGLIPGLVAASTTLSDNTLGFWASGYVDDDTSTGSNAFAGVVKEGQDNSSGSAGDLSCELYTEGVFYLPGSGLAQSDVGSVCYASDNYTVTTTSTNNTQIGRIVDFVSATLVGVKIEVIQNA